MVRVGVGAVGGEAEGSTASTLAQRLKAAMIENIRGFSIGILGLISVLNFIPVGNCLPCGILE
jgi:hypothetical protein